MEILKITNFIKAFALLIVMGLNWLNPAFATPTNSNITQIIKSANDDRNYASLILPNGLKLLVISDKNAQRSAVSLDVNVGSDSDPKEFLGLAHFLEHMLFLGTDKFPNADEFMQYIRQHGGQNNAYTSFRNTNYFFDIDPKYLKPALERFSQFFVAPLMQAKYVDRERNAINAEYHSKLKDPLRMDLDVFKQAINSNHPYAKFTVGSLATLPSATVRQALLNFYQKYYTADHMAVVILGRESTQTLLQWGKNLFKDVPMAKTKIASVSSITTEKLFNQTKLPLLVENKSLRADKNLFITFALPYSQAMVYHKIYDYIAYNLNYEGQHGLADTLKNLGLVSSVQTGIFDIAGKEAPFTINIILTEKGYQQINQVLAIVFNYLDVLKQDKNTLERYQELANIAQTNFKYQEKSQSVEEVLDLSERLNQYPAQDILRLNAIYAGLDAKLLNQIFAHLTLEQALVQISAPNLNFKTKTKFYQVPYTVKSLNIKDIQAQQLTLKTSLQQLHLPIKNQFLSSEYPLQKVTQTIEKQQNIAGVDLFYKQDPRFKVPKTVVKVALQPQPQNLSVQEQTALALLVEILNEQMLGTFYQASLAGIQGGFTFGDGVLSLNVSGYQPKLPQLLAMMLQNLQNFSTTPAIFQRVKESYRQSLENFKTEIPFRQTLPYLKQYLVPNFALVDEKLQALGQIDLNRLEGIKRQVLANLAVRMLVYGNENFAYAQNLTSQVAKTFAQANLKYTWQNQKVLPIKQAQSRTLTFDHQDNAVVYYLQSSHGYKALAEVALLSQIMSAEFFNDLRTEQQLGYIVATDDFSLHKQAGLIFIVESPKYDTSYITQQIEKFQQAYGVKLTQLTAKEYAKHQKILINNLSQQPENLAESASQYWQNIMLTKVKSDYNLEIVKALKTLSRQEFIQQMQQLLSSKNKVIIYAVPKNSNLKNISK